MKQKQAGDSQSLRVTCLLFSISDLNILLLKKAGIHFLVFYIQKG